MLWSSVVSAWRSLPGGTKPYDRNHGRTDTSLPVRTHLDRDRLAVSVDETASPTRSRDARVNTFPSVHPTLCKMGCIASFWACWWSANWLRIHVGLPFHTVVLFRGLLTGLGNRGNHRHQNLKSAAYRAAFLFQPITFLPKTFLYRTVLIWTAESLYWA
jgi:hypothetical protein